MCLAVDVKGDSYIPVTNKKKKDLIQIFDEKKSTLAPRIRYVNFTVHNIAFPAVALGNGTTSKAFT